VIAKSKFRKLMISREKNQFPLKIINKCSAVKILKKNSFRINIANLNFSSSKT
jgi:hypothetical protein